MAINSGFFNSIGGDRKYKAEFFARYFASFIGNGVFPNPSNNLQVISNNNMVVTVKTGKAWINGFVVFNDGDYNFELEPSDGLLSRIDRIVLRWNKVNRDIELAVKKGDYSDNPSPTNLERTADIFELALADVLVANGVISVTQANITDLRLNSELCGIVHGTVEQVDTTTLFNQYKTWFNETTASELEEFEIWFDSVKDILDENVAGHLLNLINENKDSIEEIQNAQAIQGTIIIPKDGWEASGDESYPLKVEIPITNLKSNHTLEIYVDIPDVKDWLSCDPCETILAMDGKAEIYAMFELSRDIGATYKVVI